MADLLPLVSPSSAPGTAPVDAAPPPGGADAAAVSPAGPTHSESQTEKPTAPPVTEVGGRSGPDPTRYGDWEKNGRCIDF